MDRSSRALAFVACAACAAVLASFARDAAASEDLERARLLDQQGVRAYKEERYNDAIRFFDEAYRLGGPPSELWNIAKCHLRLDDPEDASKEIEKYLAQTGLSPDDRAEATQQLHEIQHRHSTVTVASSPSGAAVYLDGKHPGAVGVTPATLDVPPGSHTITLEHPGYEPYEKSVEARFGRGLLVDAQLSRNSSGNSLSGGAAVVAQPAPEPSPPVGPSRPHRVVIDGQLGFSAPEHGSIGGPATVAGLLGVSYVAFDAHRLVVTVGVRATLTGDSWSNNVGAPNNPTNCGAPIPADEAATALSAFLTGGAAWRASPRWRLGGDLGVGIATYSASEVGGDLFTPTCRPSIGPVPAVYLAGSASYAFSHELRLLLSPVILQAQPAFDGARNAPKDASGLWIRYAFAAGLAFDVF
jgi:hypothetical protein